MNEKTCIEIAEFKIVEGITEKDFIRIVNCLEEDFHSRQSGFVSTELIREEEKNCWIMVQHWETVNEARKASRQMMKEAVTIDFREALDPKSVKLRYLNHIKKWKI